jgi:flavodoxin
MNLGIILYSQTGNTLSVAEKLAKVLENKGHTVNLLKVEALNTEPKSSAPVKLKTTPDVAPYEAVIFASPVQAFSLAPAMKLYLGQIASLKGKEVYCFVTQHLKKDWMGGRHATRQIQAACRHKGAEAISGGIVHWSHSDREGQINALIKKLGAI